MGAGNANVPYPVGSDCGAVLGDLRLGVELVVAWPPAHTHG